MKKNGINTIILNMAKFKNIAVLMGGTSSERDVSLASGRAVAEALETAGYTVKSIVLDEDDLGNLPSGIEAVFLALHGGYGEGGGVQQRLDELGIPYTGAGAKASRIAMDKVATKKILASRGIPTPEAAVLSQGKKSRPMSLPLVVKPPLEGSSVGISIVVKEEEWLPAVELTYRFGADVLVEKYIPGREVTVAVLDAEVLPAIEIRPASGWYGYEAKYLAGDTEYRFMDHGEEPELIDLLNRWSLAAVEAVGVRGVARVDFRVDPAGNPFVLEINTLPGFTGTSLVPKAAQKAGMKFPEICGRIIEMASYDKTVSESALEVIQ